MLRNIDIVADKEIFSILNTECPSDWELDELDTCEFKKTGHPNDMECLKCWTLPVEREEL